MQTIPPEVGTNMTELKEIFFDMMDKFERTKSGKSEDIEELEMLAAEVGTNVDLMNDLIHKINGEDAPQLGNLIETLYDVKTNFSMLMH